MTENERLTSDEGWLSLDLPAAMRCVAGGKGIHRKLRLFAVACVRAIPEALQNLHLRKVIEIAECYADGLVPPATFAGCEAVAAMLTHDSSARAGSFYWSAHAVLAACAEDRNLSYSAIHAADDAADAIAADPGHPLDLIRRDAARLWQLALFRDLVRNPSKAIQFDPKWRTVNVVDLARTIYEERAFERLPILTDALLDAGCTDEELLSHCHGPGPHARGCWLVDWAIGKDC